MSFARSFGLMSSACLFLTLAGACEGSPSTHDEPSPEGLDRPAPPVLDRPAPQVHETPPVASDEQVQPDDALTAQGPEVVTPSPLGGGGRPECYYSDPLRGTDIMTNLGTLAEARAVLSKQLAASGPAALRWADPIGAVTELEIRLVSWDTEARGDYPGGTCFMLSGTFHISTADGLLDADVQGGITKYGFSAVLSDPAQLAALHERLDTSLRVLEISLGPSGGGLMLVVGQWADTGPLLNAAHVEPFPIPTVAMAAPIGGARGYRAFCDFEPPVTGRVQFEPALAAAASAFETALASKPFTLSWYKDGVHAHEGGPVPTTPLQLRVVSGGDQLRRDAARAKCAEIPYVLHASTEDGQFDVDIPGTFDGESFVGDFASLDPLAPLVPAEMPTPLHAAFSFWPAYPSGGISVEAAASAGPQEHSEVEVALFSPPREE